MAGAKPTSVGGWDGSYGCFGGDMVQLFHDRLRDARSSNADIRLSPDDVQQVAREADRLLKPAVR